MMCVLMGVRDRHRLARACDLGLAMQLTNIARDVGADAALGRIYLPRDWFAEAGIDPDAFLRRPAPLPEIRAMTARLLREADRLYLRAEPGIAGLPLTCRPGIFAARHIYASIGGAVRARGCDSVTGRAHTGRARKLGWLGLSGLRAALSTVQPRMATLYAKPAPEVAFLVDAAASKTQTTRSDTLIDALARLRAQDLARRNVQTGMDRRSA
jgi:phytoene synthase